MKSKPDGISLALMRKIAKDEGMKHVSKSHMFDLKKRFAEELRPPKPGDEALIMSCALAEERTGIYPSNRTQAYNALIYMRRRRTARIAEGAANAAEEAVKIGAGSKGDKLIVAVSILRASGIRSISLYPDSGVESIVFFHP